MPRGHRYLTYEDASLLNEAIRSRRSSWRTYSPLLESLEAKLNSRLFEIVRELPVDAVALGSRVRLRDARTGRDHWYEIAHDVWCSPALESDESLCVFSPLGQAILGACVGDVVRILLDGQPRTFTLMVVQQPVDEGVMMLQSECFVG